MKMTPRASTTNALPLFFHESAAYNQFTTQISSLAQQWKTRSAGINFELSLKYSRQTQYTASGEKKTRL
jgi:hypothetical protein